ncbi:MAG: ATP-binding cassette domain-containing protein [Ilumatobacteraceae bacterium]
MSIDNVTKHWDATSGLATTSLQLHAGEFVALQGRSGSGKSTLLAFLAGWCNPDSGTINRHGTWADQDRWRRWNATAIAPQTLTLADELSVAENLEHVLRLAGIRQRQLGPRVTELLESFDLTEQARRLPAEISLGQQQRTAIARAAIVRPQLLLADEPTCHQDPEHAATVITVLSHLTTSGTCVLTTSHDPTIADAATRTISLDHPEPTKSCRLST